MKPASPSIFVLKTTYQTPVVEIENNVLVVCCMHDELVTRHMMIETAQLSH